MPPETKTTEEEAPAGNNEEITKVLVDLQAAADRLNKPAEEEKPVSTAPSYADQRESDRKALGFTEEQMQAHERTVARTQAPLVESTAWGRLEKKPDIEAYRKEIEAEASIYPPERRTPEIMEKIFYMVKGRRADSKPAAAPGKTPPETKVTRGPGYTGNEAGLSERRGGSEEGAEGEALDDKEKFVAEKLGISEVDYAKSKKVGKHIRELRIPDSRPATSLADIELRRMQGRR